MMAVRFLVSSFIGTGAVAYLIYRVSTYKEERVWIKEKHRYELDWKRGYLPPYVFFDSQQNMYSIPFSTLSHQWNPKEKWLAIEQGGVYFIRYWGVHRPWMGLYRRVDHLKRLDDGK